MSESGLMKYWQDQGFRQSSQCTGLERTGYQSQITLTHVYGAFYMLAMLSSAGLLILFCEVLYTKTHNVCQTITGKGNVQPTPEIKHPNDGNYVTRYQIEFESMFKSKEINDSTTNENNCRLLHRSIQNKTLCTKNENTAFKRQSSVGNSNDNIAMVATVANRLISFKSKVIKKHRRS